MNSMFKIFFMFCNITNVFIFIHQFNALCLKVLKNITFSKKNVIKTTVCAPGQTNMETWKVPIAQPIHRGLCCLSIRITPIVLKQNSQPDCILETDIIKKCTECTNRKFSDLWIECTGLEQTLVNGILEQLFIMTGWGVMTCAGVAVAPSVVIVCRWHEHRWTHLEWSRSCIKYSC